jgi:hypothetical protein
MSGDNDKARLEGATPVFLVSDIVSTMHCIRPTWVLACMVSLGMRLFSPNEINPALQNRLHD